MGELHNLMLIMAIAAHGLRIVSQSLEIFHH